MMKQTVTNARRRYRQAVRDAWMEVDEEGTLEIDDDAEVSSCPGGHYVAAWVWVPGEDGGAE
jgi:hypothetical protein